ncbi:helix-turn-helix transcriptional regulator [Paenibacillus sp. FSL H8-0104]|uniref:helix-turn-helix domain-containing protein n=1 Tax=Paenibacillus sp. FSL H8-0104 TaxID=2954509 RepID=UPI0030FD7685
MITADNLKTVRMYAGVSARSLAEMLDVDPSYISLIETGRCPLPTDRARQIQEALRLDMEKLRLIQDTFDRLREGNT